MQSVIEMDRVDEQSGQMEDIHHSLLTAYSQYKSKSGRWGSRKFGVMSRSNSAHDTAERGEISHA